jgi:hypothetical protein
MCASNGEHIFILDSNHEYKHTFICCSFPKTLNVNEFIAPPSVSDDGDSLRTVGVLFPADEAHRPRRPHYS